MSLVLTNGRSKLTEPLESVTFIFGTLTLIALGIGVVFTVFGTSAFRGFYTTVCVTQPGVSYSDSGWVVPSYVGARPGSSLSINGTVQACAVHPALAQRALSTVAELPTIVLWVSLLLLLWLIIRAARRDGPFTAGVATAMRRLGWFILAGSLAAAIVHALAVELLLNTMITSSSLLPNLIWEPIRALVPGPALTGAALLTFARIFTLGAAMEDDMKGTV